MDFLHALKKAQESHQLPDRVHALFLQLYETYVATLTAAGVDFTEHQKIFSLYLKLIIQQLAHPYHFEPYHQKITSPIDHHRFGMELFRPMVDTAHSVLLHPHNVEKMSEQMQKGENVILFANHQTEVDPILMQIALEKSFPDFAPHVIFVAGDRVISDPLAVPLSMGCNLLCIYSKRYIDVPPERKEEKLVHNQRTMKRMKELLAQGGKAIYVAPSGGRDRCNAQGEIVLAHFDPDSVEMFRLMAKQATTSTHFYPLALKTYYILPPPQSIEIELGEKRLPSRQGAHFAFGNEIEMEHFLGAELKDRHAKRTARALHIFNLMKHDYHQLP